MGTLIHTCPERVVCQWEGRYVLAESKRVLNGILNVNVSRMGTTCPDTYILSVAYDYKHLGGLPRPCGDRVIYFLVIDW